MEFAVEIQDAERRIEHLCKCSKLQPQPIHLKAGAANPAAHPLLQKLMAGKAAKGEEVTKLHLSVEMMPQVSFMMGSLGDLGIYYDILSGVG